ncbi:MAG: M14 family metallopeptidase [Rariglobus sp.]
MMTFAKRWIWMLGLAALSVAVAPSIAPLVAAPVTVQKRQSWSYEGGALVFSNDFSGARLNGVAPGEGEGRYTLTIDREGPGVSNASSWYAFAIESKTARKLEITLSYVWARHRYAPKIRVGETGEWRALPSSQVKSGAARNETVLTINAPAGRIYVSGGPMITLAEHTAWTDALVKTNASFVTRREFGRSVAGRPLTVLETRTAKAPDAGTVIVMTWQHPPEYTGTRAFQGFVEIVLGDTAQARAFREKFNLVIVPVANPDGVHEGHWRNNLGDIDLNRDWRKFSQPETRALSSLFKTVRNPVLFLDYHSTKKTLFYTQLDESAPVPNLFTLKWTDAHIARFPKEKVSRDTNHNPDTATSRNWAAAELKVPSITVELADEAPFEVCAAFGRFGAEEMMRLLMAP